MTDNDLIFEGIKIDIDTVLEAVGSLDELNEAVERYFADAGIRLTGQLIVRYAELIKEKIEEDDDRCDNCGRMIHEDDWIWDTQTYERHGYPEQDTIVIGYGCSFCGEKVLY